MVWFVVVAMVLVLLATFLAWLLGRAHHKLQVKRYEEVERSWREPPEPRREPLTFPNRPMYPRSVRSAKVAARSTARPADDSALLMPFAYDTSPTAPSAEPSFSGEGGSFGGGGSSGGYDGGSCGGDSGGVGDSGGGGGDGGGGDGGGGDGGGGGCD